MPMAPTSTPDTPSGQYFKAVKYIVRKVMEETTAKGDEVVGPRSKRVRQMYLDQFADRERMDEETYCIEQKKIAVDTIIRMTGEHVLRAVKHDGHGTFVVHPNCEVVDDTDNTPTRSIDPPGATDPEIYPQEAGDIIEVQVPSNVNREARRHADAYAEMTKLAVPLQLDIYEAGPSKPPPDTPSKKRRRTDEVAASDASSRYASISPRRGSNTASEAGRSRRFATLEENRRVSAPSRLGNASPVQTNNLKRRRCDDGDSMINCKEEKNHSSPPWLINALEALRAKYPNDIFMSEKEFVKCLDCRDKVISMTTKTGKPYMHSLELHLNGNKHKDNVAERISKEGKKSMMMEPSFLSMFQYGKPNFMDFPAPQPIQCFSLPALPGSPSIANGEPSFRQARAAINKYMEEIENDSAQQRVRTTFMEERVAAFEKSSEERFNELKELLTESDEKNMSSCKDLEESLANQKQESNDQVQRLEDNLVEINMNARDQDASVEQLQGEFAVSESRNHQKLNEIEERFARSDGKYYEVMGRLTTVDENSKKETEELANRVGAAEERNQELVDGILAQLTAQISNSTTRQREEIDGVFAQATTQVSDLEARHQEQLESMAQRVAASESITKDQIETVTKELATSKQFTKETFIGTMNRLLTLEKQSESTNDVESQLQIQADELQRQRDSEEGLRQSLFVQMDAHVKQTAERIQDLEKRTSEKIEAVEAACEKRIKKLEKANKEQERTIRGYDEVFKSVFGEMKGLKEYVDSVAESVSSTESRSNFPEPEPQSRRRPTGVQQL